MSYHAYRKMMGWEPKDVPHVDLTADDPRFDGYATLYLHPDTKCPLCVSWYLWTGSDSEAYIREKYAEMGYDLSHLTDVGGGNGHYAMSDPNLLKSK